MTGHAGFEKPQDCSVTVTLLDAGGVEIRLQSRQEAMFGSTIRSCAESCLEELGVENALVEIQDYGCLDFAIRARLKTAVRRARRSELGLDAYHAVLSSQPAEDVFECAGVPPRCNPLRSGGRGGVC